MSITSRVVTLIFLLNPLLLAHAGDLVLQYHYIEPPADKWHEIYYVLYGAVIAAVVLFVMAVMKKPDEIY